MTEETLEPIEQQESLVAIDWQGQQFRGNNQQILLEQLEQQGIRVPYSCRAGICGSCRIKRHQRSQSVEEMLSMMMAQSFAVVVFLQEM